MRRSHWFLPAAEARRTLVLLGRLGLHPHELEEPLSVRVRVPAYNAHFLKCRHPAAWSWDLCEEPVTFRGFSSTSQAARAAVDWLRGRSAGRNSASSDRIRLRPSASEVFHIEGDRGFVDSPVEGSGFELSVPLRRATTPNRILSLR